MRSCVFTEMETGVCMEKAWLLNERTNYWTLISRTHQLKHLLMTCLAYFGIKFFKSWMKWTIVHKERIKIKSKHTNIFKIKNIYLMEHSHEMNSIKPMNSNWWWTHKPIKGKMCKQKVKHKLGRPKALKYVQKTKLTTWSATLNGLSIELMGTRWWMQPSNSKQEKIKLKASKTSCVCKVMQAFEAKLGKNHKVHWNHLREEMMFIWTLNKLNKMTSILEFKTISYFSRLTHLSINCKVSRTSCLFPFLDADKLCLWTPDLPDDKIVNCCSNCKVSFLPIQKSFHLQFWSDWSPRQSSPTRPSQISSSVSSLTLIPKPISSVLMHWIIYSSYFAIRLDDFSVKNYNRLFQRNWNQKCDDENKENNLCGLSMHM